MLPHSCVLLKINPETLVLLELVSTQQDRAGKWIFFFSSFFSFFPHFSVFQNYFCILRMEKQ